MVTHALPVHPDHELDWMELASCQGYEDLFFNEEDELKGTRRRKEAEAKELCDSCPVERKCREMAFDDPELYGVWGGLSENERQRIAGRYRTG